MNDQKMRLASARVTNFGCFRDSGEVPIDDVTALIAENENGKTTFLRALAWWSERSVAFDEEDRWDGAPPAGALDLVSLTFEVNASAREALIGVGVPKPPKHVRVVVDTDNNYRVEDSATSSPIEATTGPIRFDVSKEALADELKKLAELVPLALDLADGLLQASPGSGVAETTVTQIRAEVVPHLPTAEEQEALEAQLVEMESAIATPGQISTSPVIEVLDAFLPALIYFDDLVDFVQDSVTYAEVSADPSRHRTMINLASIAGIDLVKVASDSPHQRLQHSRHAQATLSTEFSKYWQDDPVTILVQVDESQMTLTMEHKGRTQRPSRRSSGLKWALGFFVNFTAESKGDLSGAVLLLDEPGLHLHIKQQPKLLELFSDLANDGCQIIYATHMSHMLSPERPHTFRPLVADEDAPGATRVVPNITALPSKSDVMQPVRQVLGMGIADAIGLGGINVIAEGWAERYVLLTMSAACREKRLTCLSLTTTILPAGGSGKKMLPLAALAVGEKTKAVVLVDDDKAGRDTRTLLQKTLPGGVPSVLTHAGEGQTGRELEDLFEPSFYLELVNAAHTNINGFQPIELSDIDTSKPICNAVEEQFKARGLGRFQKLRPAMELQKQYDLGNAPDDATLAIFAELFDRINSALKNT